MPDISHKIPGQANRTSVKIFEGASDTEIRQFAEKLADGPLGQPITVPSGNVWVRTANDGTKINLRNFSTSETQTGAKWTIDIKSKDRIAPLRISAKDQVEIKFR